MREKEIVLQKLPAPARAVKLQNSLDVAAFADRLGTTHNSGLQHGEVCDGSHGSIDDDRVHRHGEREVINGPTTQPSEEAFIILKCSIIYPKPAKQLNVTLCLRTFRLFWRAWFYGPAPCKLSQSSPHRTSRRRRLT
jgi:hypothetical protein